MRLKMKITLENAAGVVLLGDHVTYDPIHIVVS